MEYDTLIDKSGYDKMTFVVRENDVDEHVIEVPIIDRYAMLLNGSVRQFPVPPEQVRGYMSDIKKSQKKLSRCFKKLKWIMKWFISEHDINIIRSALNDHINRLEKEGKNNE